MFDAEVQKLHKTRPLVHCISNPVSLNDCANFLLACGASPIMADSPEESAEITSCSHALVLNLGMLNPSRFEAMQKSAKAANQKHIPIVLDPVGIGISSYRLQSAKELIQSVQFSVIRGNRFEIMALCGLSGKAKGVDSEDDPSLSEEELYDAAHNLSNTTGAIVEVTSQTDIITDGIRRVYIKGGNEAMTRITGTGCMLSVLIGAFLAVKPDSPLEAATIASAMMKRFGEAAALNMECLNTGYSSMRTYLIDAAGRMDYLALQGGFQIEDR